MYANSLAVSAKLLSLKSREFSVLQHTHTKEGNSVESVESSVEIDCNVLFEGLSEFYTEFQLIVEPSGRLRS